MAYRGNSPAVSEEDYCCYITRARDVLATWAVFSAWMMVAHEVLFYLAHRFILHNRWGYKALGHDLHHSADATCAITAMYMSPIDFVLEILIPYLLPLCCATPWVRGFDMNAAALALGSLGGLYEHSGYNLLPGVYMADTFYHISHHRTSFAGNGVSYADGVGSFGVLDTACGTQAVAPIGSAVPKVG
jgi:sterol desaturase/sphingolipid hydroxylase (fatty acid hydroxylase superfamily)